MPDTGAPYNLPYPELADSPNVPADVQALAEAVDTELVRIDADVAAITDEFGRIATTVLTTPSGSIGTTETSVASVTGPVVAGRTYLVRFIGEVSGSTAGNDVMAIIREDTAAGNQLTQHQVDCPITNVFPRIILEAEYTADVTESKTFHLTFDLIAGTGNVVRQAAANKPNYMTLHYVYG